MLGNHLLGNPGAGDSALGNLLGNGGGRIGQLGTAPIVDAEDHIDDLVVSGPVHGHLEFVDDGLPKPRLAARPADPDPPLIHLRHSAVDDVTGEPHQEADLRGRPLPVLGRKGVEAQVPHTRLDGPSYGVEHHRLGGTVPLGAFHSPLLGPTPVPVHDDTHVPGYGLTGKAGNAVRIREGRPGHIQGCVVNLVKTHGHESNRRREWMGRSR